MNRRSLLLSPLALPALSNAQSAVTPRNWNLRYAPRIGLVPKLSIPRQLEIYSEWGFRAFEYNGLPQHTPEEMASFRKKMDDLKMSMSVFVVNRGGWRPTALPDKAAHPQFLEDCKRAVTIHNLIGNEVATVTSGLGVEHLTFEQQTRNAIEGLKRAAEIVEKTKMVLVLEPLNQKVDHAGYFVTYSEHAGEIISSVNHPQIRILFDIYHQQISEGNLIQNMTTYYDWIGYFQAGDVPGRKEPYTGEINYQNIFKFLSEKKYKGMIGMEHGLSVPGEDGLRKCFEAYRKADSW